MGVVEHHRRRGRRQGARQRHAASRRVRPDHHGQPVLLGERDEAVGQELLRLGHVGERPRRGAVPLDVDHGAVGHRGVRVGLRAAPQHHVAGQHRVPGAGGVGEQGGDGVQRWFQPESG